MDIHARVSKDLLEPGPTVIEIPVAAGEIVKNGQSLEFSHRHNDALSIGRFDMQL